ncbi:helix-turn-helix domain-containing protein [Symbiobacterium terraclitae]|uniref:helix-turn-helix domain-containing protein n=1 Tax=Symbiobacterium terraclitae TaxID=557451 RepID=UPI0035B506D6
MSTRVRDRIRARRIQLGLSQEQVAVRLQTMNINVSRNWVSAVERGTNRIPEDWICALAAALDTDPNGLLGWDEFEFRRVTR